MLPLLRNGPGTAFDQAFMGDEHRSVYTCIPRVDEATLEQRINRRPAFMRTGVAFIGLALGHIVAA